MPPTVAGGTPALRPLGVGDASPEGMGVVMGLCRAGKGALGAALEAEIPPGVG